MCNRNSHHDNGSFVHGALFGAVVGAVLGVLFAPAPGVDTRKKLKEKSHDYVEKGKIAYDEAQDAIEHVSEAAKPLIDEVERKVRPVIEKMQELSDPVKEEVMDKIAQLVDDLDDIDKDKIKRRFFRCTRR